MTYLVPCFVFRVRQEERVEKHDALQRRIHIHFMLLPD